MLNNEVGKSILLQKYSSFLQKNLSSIILSEIKDNRIQGININQVKISGDFSSAKVYISFIDLDEKEDSVIKSKVKVLNKASGFIKKCLSKSRHNLRSIPKLHFVYDNISEQNLDLLDMIEEI